MRQMLEIPDKNIKESIISMQTEVKKNTMVYAYNKLKNNKCHEDHKI